MRYYIHIAEAMVLKQREGKSMSNIKFNLHNVQDVTTGEKVRVHYSHNALTNGKTAVTLYAKDYSSSLAGIFQNVENDSDIMTDYFEKDRVRIYSDSPLYPYAVAICERLAARKAV